MMRTRTIVPLFFAVACGGGSNTSIDASSPVDASGTDGSSTIDADPGGGGSTIKISGVATLIPPLGSPTAAAGVVVSAYSNSDESTAVATATTDADGKYTLIVPAGAPLDGFLKATKDGNADTYLYPPAPLVADFANASINELATGTYSLLANTVGGGTPQQGTIALMVVDSTAALTTIADAVVTSSAAGTQIAYSTQGSSLPDLNGTKTLADGRAFIFKVPPGSVTVTATKAGTTFKTTTLKVHPGAFTTTIITE